MKTLFSYGGIDLVLFDEGYFGTGIVTEYNNKGKPGHRLRDAKYYSTLPHAAKSLARRSAIKPCKDLADYVKRVEDALDCLGQALNEV